jgi:ADP-ribose pyrophosphatase YjhB (NUDIX family)
MTVAVGGVAVHGGRVALIRRGKEPLRGRWTIPGGAVEPGETLAAAVEREMREETGLRVRCGALLEIVERVFRSRRGAACYRYVILDFACHLRRGSLQAGGDATAAAWVSAAELPRYRLTRAAERVVRKALTRAKRRRLPKGAADRRRPADQTPVSFRRIGRA